MEQAGALLKGMEFNNKKINNTIQNTPFYQNNHNYVNPFIPVYMPDRSFGSKEEITRKNPLGDLSWLIGK